MKNGGLFVLIGAGFAFVGAGLAMVAEGIARLVSNNKSSLADVIDLAKKADF